ncbi:HGGxSTG domain-containing protein [Curtobacterium sp. MCSS17_005]|uniref:HGGxSTG domain-containing protein n=1 Tax=Curtobacterium sp. MCSS17_005 TaxID=2175641 RepID=UPI000DAA0592|nr:HGGxSTG domain-containing protein [Curtobacterium sp. MCSS17_005]WIB33924.1 HGGxSTG domain-containing protein [Curtobacterium sp. MCSS17_005]
MSKNNSDLMHADTRCTARRRNGEPCRNWAMLGTNVCRMHGGAAPQVRRRAQQRILEASDKAAARLVELMQDAKVPYAVQLAAARDLLDRAQLAGKQEIEMGVTVSLLESNIEAAFVYDLDDADVTELPDEPGGAPDYSAEEAAADAAMEERQAARDRRQRKTGNPAPRTAAERGAQQPKPVQAGPQVRKGRRTR